MTLLLETGKCTDLHMEIADFSEYILRDALHQTESTVVNALRVHVLQV